MREPKRPAQKGSPAGAGSGSDTSTSNRTQTPVPSPAPSSSSQTGPVPSPSTNPGSARAPRTPKQEPDAYPQAWMSQPATPSSAGKVNIKTEMSDLSLEGPSSGPPSAGMSSGLIVPSSPLDQFKKEDPMEKMAQMTSQLGQGGNGNGTPSNLLMSLRSPSCLSPATPGHMAQHQPCPSPHSRPSVIATQGTMQGRGVVMGGNQQIGSPNPTMLNSRLAMSPSNPMQNGAQMMQMPQSNNQGPQVPDQPYMQQQSTIFVFDTSLANKAARLVMEGHFPTIVDVHMQEESTKRILSQNPLRRPPISMMSNYPASRPQWPQGVNRTAPYRAKGHVTQQQQQQHQMMGRVMSPGSGGPPMYMEQQGMPPQGQMQPEPQMSVQDEQRRAEKLAKLKKIQDMMMGPEQGMMGEMGGPGPGPGPGQGVASPHEGQRMGPGPVPPPPYPMSPAGMVTSPRVGRPPGSVSAAKRAAAAAAAAVQAQLRPAMNVPIQPGNPSFPRNEMTMNMMQQQAINEANMQMQQQRLSPNLVFDEFQQSQMGKKEQGQGNPSVMPVPSPQPIQYLNQMDVQEVVIQKQPNRNFFRSQQGPEGPAAQGQMRPVGLNGHTRARGMHQMQEQFSPHSHMYSDQLRMQGMMGGGPPGYSQGQPGPPNQYSSPSSDPAFAGHMHLHPGHDMSGHPHMQPRLRGPFPPQPGGFDPSLRHPSQPQTVNNTYVNAHMTIEQLNIQNGMPYENAAQYSHSQTSMTYMGGQEQGQQGPGPGPGPGPGMMMGYEGSPQIQIKPNAPNTIQYLPNRPPAPKQPRPPPNLDFLQQYTNTAPQPRPYQFSPGLQPNMQMSSGPNGQMASMFSGGNPEMGMPGVNMNIQQHYGPPQGVQGQQLQGQPMQQQQTDQYGSTFHQFQEQLYASNVSSGRSQSMTTSNQASSAASIPRL